MLLFLCLFVFSEFKTISVIFLKYYATMLCMWSWWHIARSSTVWRWNRYDYTKTTIALTFKLSDAAVTFKFGQDQEWLHVQSSCQFSRHHPSHRLEWVFVGQTLKILPNTHMEMSAHAKSSRWQEMGLYCYVRVSLHCRHHQETDFGPETCCSGLQQQPCLQAYNWQVLAAHHCSRVSRWARVPGWHLLFLTEEFPE